MFQGDRKVTKTSNSPDYSTVLGTTTLSTGEHQWTLEFTRSVDGAAIGVTTFGDGLVAAAALALCYCCCCCWLLMLASAAAAAGGGGGGGGVATAAANATAAAPPPLDLPLLAGLPNLGEPIWRGGANSWYWRQHGELAYVQAGDSYDTTTSNDICRFSVCSRPVVHLSSRCGMAAAELPASHCRSERS